MACSGDHLSSFTPGNLSVDNSLLFFHQQRVATWSVVPPPTAVGFSDLHAYRNTAQKFLHKPMITVNTTKIKKHLSSCGFKVTRIGDDTPQDTTLNMLAMLLSFQFPIFRHLLRHMKGKMREKPGFFLPLAGLTRNEAVAIRNICHLLQKNSLLDYCQVDHRLNQLRGSVASNDRAFAFLSGGWLERCIGIQVGGFLNLDPQRIQFAQNIHVIRPQQTDGVSRVFELDAVLAVDDLLYWWEAKCGQFTKEHLLRYSAVAQEMKLPPQQCFLVLAEPPAGTGLGRLIKQIDFQVVYPEEIAIKIEEIEERYRVDPLSDLIDALKE
jgi:hypothetical protein